MGLFGRKFRRILAGVATGGASEILRNKRLRKAVLTGGLSEVKRPRTQTEISIGQRLLAQKFLRKR